MTERFHHLPDGGRMRVVEAGTGRPILLVHGWPTNADAWRGQIEELSREHRVLAVDLRGFGASTPMERPTVARLAADLKELLDGDAIDSDAIDAAVMVGWSLGGSVVLSYLEQFGAHRLRGIGIVDVSPRLLPADDWALGEGTPFSPDGLAEWSRAWDVDPRAVATDVYTMGLVDPEGRADEREWLVEESMKADVPTAMTTLRDAFVQDYRPVLPTVGVPALLLYGAASTSTTEYVRDFMVRTIPDSTLVVFAESSHCLMLEEPDKFNTAVARFARSI